ncbi:hypothetical protein VYA_08970 [Vibrio alfacsensis]|nr:hypothetical protein VYA_08970 [Vibrio alfacsensis]
MQSGSFQWLYESKQTVVFARQLGEETIVAAFNFSEDVELIDIPLWKLGLNAKHLIQICDSNEKVNYERHISVNIPALTSKLWQLK